MKFVAKQIPEGINTSPDHPLKGLFILLLGTGFLLVLTFLVLMLLSDFLVRLIPVETEREWFNESRLTFIQQHNTSHEFASAERYLAQLVQKLRSSHTNQALVEGIHYSIYLIDSEMSNAFITPGGHIFVTTELMRYVNSENSLAMVIAHEMAHQVHRHPIRSMGRGIVIAVALMMFTGMDGSEWVTGILAETVNLGLLAHSREQEREADKTGLQLLQGLYGHAGGSSYFFEQLNRHERFQQSGLNEYLSTHPNTDERLAYLQQYDSHSGTLIPLPDVVRQLRDSVTRSGKTTSE